jgi:hypothetical protein
MKRCALLLTTAVATAMVLAASSAAEPYCEVRVGVCPDTRTHQSYDGKYIGHDEPATLFYSSRSGSGNSNNWLLRLPHESARSCRSRTPPAARGTSSGAPLSGLGWICARHRAIRTRACRARRTRTRTSRTAATRALRTGSASTQSCPTFRLAMNCMTDLTICTGSAGPHDAALERSSPGATRLTGATQLRKCHAAGDETWTETVSVPELGDGAVHGLAVSGQSERRSILDSDRLSLAA